MNLYGLILSQKKPVRKGYILYDSIYITFFKRQNFRNEEPISGCQGLGMEGMEGDVCSHKRVTQGILVAMVLFCVLILVADTQICTFDKIV